MNYFSFFKQCSRRGRSSCSSFKRFDLRSGRRHDRHQEDRHQTSAGPYRWSTDDRVRSKPIVGFTFWKEKLEIDISGFSANNPIVEIKILDAYWSKRGCSKKSIPNIISNYQAHDLLRGLLMILINCNFLLQLIKKIWLIMTLFQSFAIRKILPTHINSPR